MEFTYLFTILVATNYRRSFTIYLGIFPRLSQNLQLAKETHVYVMK